ncbi:TrkH family potassium uptake protein [Maliponia aquimaris]|uniref:Trk system potassium uptake protein n=1 Tax=Maliponia aquimaris TaxID=1673631 RepID=A0A238JSL6_9RHOB|nr:TrkH family potassium uptake protein [Maliponia aquimaris]SMX33463.1 Trk system potassium uptake protein TrkG [Maliponia aquimaris]
MSLVILANGVLLLGMSVLMALIAALFADTREVFLDAALLSGLVGGLVALAVANRKDAFRLVHSFLLTSSIWVCGAAAGALPLWLWGLVPVDAFFEAMSGITTTGSTVMTGLDDTPKGLLLWRAILQWLGGIGFIVAGIAVLPILRVGGMQLFRTESSERGEKEMATAARFASATFWVYLVLTVICLVVYRAGGMTRFEALVHALTTLSTGGYSTSDASFGQFDSAFLQWAGTFFMLAGAVPFAWYIRMLTGKGLQNEQVRALLILFAVSIAGLTAWRVWTSAAGVEESLRQVAFNVVSVVTTTGYATTDYTTWGPFAAAAFLMLTALGGCSGSTSGGAKMMRWIVFFRVTRQRLARIRHPSLVRVTRYDGRIVQDDVGTGVAVFFVLYGTTILALAMALDLYGLDLTTSFSGALTAVANVGPGIGDVIGPAGTFQSLPEGAKWLLCFGMFAGRLEMMTVFVLFSGAFWREAL